MPKNINRNLAQPCRRLMIFIDGGYLRHSVRKLFKDQKADWLIDYSKLRNYITDVIASQGIRPELIRTYYYDAIIDEGEDQDAHVEQDIYFMRIRSKKLYEIRLGRLIKIESGPPRQKGVDILIALDMLSKGYMKHYDIAAFLGGDNDFLDLISAVKNSAGRQVYGFYFPFNVSKELAQSFDVESRLTREKLLHLIKRRPRK